MGRPPEPYKETWRGHVRGSKDDIEIGREKVKKLRAFVKILREVSEGPEAATFIDDLADTIDDVGAIFNSIDDRQSYLVAIGERASNDDDQQ